MGLRVLAGDFGLLLLPPSVLQWRLPGLEERGMFMISVWVSACWILGFGVSTALAERQLRPASSQRPLHG